MLKNKRKLIKIGDSSPISLNDGDNIGLIFDALATGTYTIQILDGEEVITEETGILVDYDRPPEPAVVISDVVITDTTGAGNADGSADATITISDFVGQGTATLEPDPNTISPINLNDGANPISFTDLPAGDYQVDIYDDDTFIDSFTFTIADPTTPAEATIDNIVPTSPTTEAGTDGTISFDTTITGCDGVATAVLNPASGTTPITLTDGANTGLSFSPLPAGSYTIQIYCDDTLIEESDLIEVPEFVPEGDGTDTIIIVPDGELIPSDETDISVDDGKTLAHDLLFFKSQAVNVGVETHQIQIILGNETPINQNTNIGLQVYNPDDPQGDRDGMNFNKASDILFSTRTTSPADAIKGLNFIKSYDVELTQILEEGQYEAGDSFILLEDFTTYKYLISKSYFWSSPGTGFVSQYTYSIIDVSHLVLNNNFNLKMSGNGSIYTTALQFSDGLNGVVELAHSNEYLISLWATNELPDLIDLNMSINGTTITLDDYSNGSFLVVNGTYLTHSFSQLIHIPSIKYDGITEEDYWGQGWGYFIFNSDKTITINALNTDITLTSIKKIIL